jgi:hypothetical protein
MSLRLSWHHLEAHQPQLRTRPPILVESQMPTPGGICRRRVGATPKAAYTIGALPPWVPASEKDYSISVARPQSPFLGLLGELLDDLIANEPAGVQSGCPVLSSVASMRAAAVTEGPLNPFSLRLSNF